MARPPAARDLTQALIGGGLAGAVALGGGFAIGRLSGLRAVQLLEASLPTARFLASGMMTAGATILALMLTLLSLSYATEFRMRSEHYERVKTISRVDTLGFVLATVFLLLLIIPLGETENIPASWYDIIYYSVLTTAAALGGLLIAVVLMLYHTVREVIDTIAAGGSGPLAREERSGEPED